MSLIEEAGWHAPIPVAGAVGSVSADIEQTVDVLGIIGVELLTGYLYAGAGIGHATGTFSADVCAGGSCVELSESGDHTGFKVVVGFDSPMGDNLNLITKVHYADPGDADCFGAPLEFVGSGVTPDILYHF